MGNYPRTRRRHLRKCPTDALEASFLYDNIVVTQRNQMNYDIELKLSKKELEYLYFAIENYTPLDGIENLSTEEQFELYESTKNKIVYEFISDHIFDLLNQLEEIVPESEIYDDWCDKLWVEVPDGDGVLITRNLQLWNWSTVGELQELVEKLEAEVKK